MLPDSVRSAGHGTREVEASNDLPPLPVASDLLSTIVLTDLRVEMVEIQLSTAQRWETFNGSAACVYVCACVYEGESVCV